MPLTKLFLKKDEERRIQTGHLWIYSNEINNQKSPLRHFSPGEIVEIFSAREKFLGIGYINPNTLICARVLTTNSTKINEDFFYSRIKRAFELRQQYLLTPFYRLVFGESDFLPGLIIDRYDQIFVLQFNTVGIENLQEFILTALKKLFQPQTIILKNDNSIRQLEGLKSYVTIADGPHITTTLIEENSVKFHIPLLEGQKTGWFYDHRDNRARLKKYVRNKSVLDVFSYVGGWGIQAANYGAKEVLCIDSSAIAIQYVNANATLNNCGEKIKCQQEEVFFALKQLLHEKKKYDVIILDPPALIKKRKDYEQGFIAYLRLNELALQLLNRKGLLISCSCSLHMSAENLVEVIRRASIKTQKKIQILEIGFQSLDHPIHPAMPETAYLKAFFCEVNTNEL